MYRRPPRDTTHTGAATYRRNDGGSSAVPIAAWIASYLDCLWRNPPPETNKEVPQRYRVANVQWRENHHTNLFSAFPGFRRTGSAPRRRPRPRAAGARSGGHPKIATSRPPRFGQPDFHRTSRPPPDSHRRGLPPPPLVWSARRPYRAVGLRKVSAWILPFPAV